MVMAIRRLQVSDDLFVGVATAAGRTAALRLLLGGGNGGRIPSVW